MRGECSYCTLGCGLANRGNKGARIMAMSMFSLLEEPSSPQETRVEDSKWTRGGTLLRGSLGSLGCPLWWGSAKGLESATRLLLLCGQLRRNAQLLGTLCLSSLRLAKEARTLWLCAKLLC